MFIKPYTVFKTLIVFVSLLIVGNTAFSQKDQIAFKIGGKAVKMEQVYKEDQASFYDLEKKKFELIDRFAREQYLDYFWQKRAKEHGLSIEAAKKEYEKKNVKVSEKEVKENMERLKDHPNLKKLTKKKREEQIRNYLMERNKRDIYDGIIESGLKKGDLLVVFKKPVEPVYSISISKDDLMKYGPEDTDIKPLGCEGDNCPITVVEYSEFQCPFCTRVLPSIRKLMAEYKGKIRWTVRDFPLSFHDRARFAAIAAKCASEQSKYWQMYSILFKNQRNLTDDDLKKYADKIGLNKSKFEKCVKNPKKVEKLIDKNFKSGVALGVTGTPAFFINGRRLSGAMPYEEFKRVIDDELSKKKKK